jgi:hypothetical protein
MMMMIKYKKLAADRGQSCRCFCLELCHHCFFAVCSFWLCGVFKKTDIKKKSICSLPATPLYCTIALSSREITSSGSLLNLPGVYNLNLFCVCPMVEGYHVERGGVSTISIYCASRLTLLYVSALASYMFLY